MPVSYSGGVFGAGPLLDAFGAELAALYGGYELREPLYEPVVGAAIYAAKLAEMPLDGGALSRLRSDQRGSTTDWRSQ